MDQCAHEVCASYWEGIIKSCSQRRLDRSLKVGCTKTVSANKVTITGSASLGNVLSSEWDQTHPFLLDKKTAELLLI